MRRVLDVGGWLRDSSPLPSAYADMQRVVLDIEPFAGVDIIGDARTLHDRADLREAFDAVMCSHMIEHVDPWDVPSVVRGLHHAVKPDGWVEIRTPDIKQVAARLAECGLPTQIAYDSAAGPITLHDLLHGYPPHISTSQYMRHRTSFTPESLARCLREFFSFVGMGLNERYYEIVAVACKQPPTATTCPYLFVDTPDVVPDTS